MRILASLNGKIEYGDLGMVDEFQTVSRFTNRDVKITTTGSHMLARVAYDEHYGGTILRSYRRPAASISRSMNRGSLPSTVTRADHQPGL